MIPPIHAQNIATCIIEAICIRETWSIDPSENPHYKYAQHIGNALISRKKSLPGQYNGLVHLIHLDKERKRFSSRKKFVYLS